MTQAVIDQSLLPRFQQIDPNRIEADITQLLQTNRQTLNALLATSKPYTWDNLIAPLEEMQDTLSKTWAPISHLHSVMQSDELRKAYHATLPLMTEYYTELSQSEALFKAITQIKQSADFEKLTAAQRKVIDNELRDFKLAGIGLPADKKARLAELQQQLSQRMTQFSENLLDATNAWQLHLTDKNQLAGLPPQALQLAVDNAKRRNLEGYVITLDYPSFSTAVKFLKDRELRKTIYTAYTTRASEIGPHAGKWDNSNVMTAILNIRHEMANIIGFKQYVDYSLATKMAKSADEVLEFLNNLVAQTKHIGKQEYNELCAEAAKDGITSLEAWDLAYYSEKLQIAQFDFTQEDFRPYFPFKKP